MEKNMDEKMDDRSGHGSGVTGKSGLPHMTMIVILGMAGFVSAADNWVISALLPAVAADFGTGIVTAAGMLTAYLVPYGIMQPVYGYLADRWGKARILKGVLSGLTAATAGCVLAPALVWLMICRFVAGFFAAGIIAVSLAMIGDETEPEKRPQSVGLFMGMVFLGQGVSAGFGGFFAGWLDWRMTFVCLIAIALVTLWLYRRLPEGRVAPSQNAFLSETIRIVLSEKGRIIFPMAFAAGFLMLGAYSYLGACLHEVAGAPLFPGRTGRDGVRSGFVCDRFTAGMAVETVCTPCAAGFRRSAGRVGCGSACSFSVGCYRDGGGADAGGRLYFHAVHFGDTGVFRG